MKTITLILSFIVVLGCAAKSEFDITPAQAKNAKMRGGPNKITIGGNKMDLSHLPPGAVKHEHVFTKGETLPDGTPAKGGEKIVTVEVKKDGKPGEPSSADKDITITQ